MTKNILIKYYVAAGIIFLMVLGVVIGALLFTGGPFLAQSKAYDQERVSNISNLKYAINSYASNNNVLPRSLNDLINSARYMKDPKTGETYGYSVLKNTEYELFANFETDASHSDNFNLSSPEYSYIKGKNCFTYPVSIMIRNTSTPSPYNTIVPTISSTALLYTSTPYTQKCTPNVYIGTVSDKTTKYINISFDHGEQGGSITLYFSDYNIVYRGEPSIGNKVRETIKEDCSIELEKL